MDPFAPIPQAPPVEGSGPACPRCAKPMDPASASYDGAGRLVCRACLSASTVAQANATIEAKDPTSTRNLYLGAFSALGLGIGTCCLSGMGRWFFVLAFFVVINGAWVSLFVLRDPDAKARLGNGYWLVLGASLAGVCLGLAALVIGALTFVGVAMFESHPGYY